MTKLSRIDRLVAFVAESNRIEGIMGEPREADVKAHSDLLALDTVRVADLERFVLTVAGAPLRRVPGQNVRVGSHRPPPGGPIIEEQLSWILSRCHDLVSVSECFHMHREYETLHPFMDGNGRSGRALWAWQNFRAGRNPFWRGFLHQWYYDSLQASR